jgi:hypothetical protein
MPNSRCTIAYLYYCVQIDNSGCRISRQFLDARNISLTKRGMGRAPKPGTIRPQGRRGKKSVVTYLPVEKWKELRILAVLNDMSIDAIVHRGVDLVIKELKDKRAS